MGADEVEGILQMGGRLLSQQPQLAAELASASEGLLAEVRQQREAQPDDSPAVGQVRRAAWSQRTAANRLQPVLRSLSKGCALPVSTCSTC